MIRLVGLLFLRGLSRPSYRIPDNIHLYNSLFIYLLMVLKPIYVSEKTQKKLKIEAASKGVTLTALAEEKLR